MINDKAGVFFSRKYFRAGLFGGRQLPVFVGSLVLSLLFFNLVANVQISEAKSVSSVATAGQSAALTYGTAATVTFKVTVNITGSGKGASVNLSASPAITGVTYAWYDSSNTTRISWPKNVSKTPTTYTLRVTTTVSAAATAGTTITVTDRGSGLSGSSTLTINRAALTITAAANTKTYDGTTSAAATPGVTGLKGSDTVTGLAESYADKTAGTNKTINVTAYTVNDGSNGNNYTVTTVSSTAGVINLKTLTITGITANDKVYDGNTSATLNTGGAGLVGVVGGDDVRLVTTSAVGSFSDSSIGTNKTVHVSGLTLSGADAGNYSITEPTTTASITGSNINVNPGSPFDFGSVNVGLPSSPQTFTISNTGNTGLQIAMISSDNTEFAISNDYCSGQTLAASGSCTLQVTFSPSTFGARGATLTIPSNDPDSPTLLIFLNGRGETGHIEVSPGSPFDFGIVNVGSSSLPQIFTISNTGNIGLVIGTISSDNTDFVISNDNCSGQTLAASGNCTLQATFTPSTFGSRGATLTIPSNDPDTPSFSITLSGVGSAANIEVSPAPVDLGSVNVGSSSSPQILTISNTGNIGLVIGVINSSNATEFAISNDNCSGQIIAASGSCTLQVTFTPSTFGSRGATLTIPSNDSDTPSFSVTLSGMGTAANIEVSPGSPFDFGSVNVGSSSSPQTFTISNTGDIGLQIAIINSNNTEFAISNDNCSGQTIATSSNCTLQVTFVPSTFGSRGATLTIPSNDPDTPSFSITLNGMGNAANIGVSPASPVDFGSVNVGSSSLPQTFTISNSGNTGLQIAMISSDNTDFIIPNDNCSGQTIGTSGNCTLQVTFKPSTAGPSGATLTIPSNDPGSPTFITLIGSGNQLQYYTLNVNITGNGRVESTPAGISCVSGNGCSAQFNASSVVILTATNLDVCPSSITWSEACIGNGSTCDVTMTNDPTRENVTFTVLIGQVKNMRTGALYNTIQDAYDASATIPGDVLRASNVSYVGPAFDLLKDIEVQGGYGCNFANPPVGFTTFNTFSGSVPVVISGGSVVLDGIVID